MILSRGQSEYIAAVIAVVSMVFLSMLYINILEGIQRAALLSIKRIDSSKEYLEVSYDREKHVLSIDGDGRAAYIVYLANGELYLDEPNSTSRYIDLKALPKYSEIINRSYTVDNICIVTYSQNMFCAKNRDQREVNSSVELSATISKCTVMVSRFLTVSDLFKLLENYYPYNCTSIQYPAPSIGIKVTFSFNGDVVRYSVADSSGYIWSFGEIPYSSLPQSNVLLAYNRTVYRLGFTDLVFDIYVYYSFPEVGTAKAVDNNVYRYVYTVPRIYVLQSVVYRDYLLAVSSRASCTSSPCYLLYAIRDFVDYPWQSYSSDFGWWTYFKPGAKDYTYGLDDGYTSYRDIDSRYRVNVYSRFNLTFNDPYAYNRVDQMNGSVFQIGFIDVEVSNGRYSEWYPKAFLTPASGSYATYVKRAMSIYDTQYARFYIYTYSYDTRRYAVYIDYRDPATHIININLRYGGDRTLYIFEFGSFMD